ncbi:MAG: hypothetical protein PHI85_08720 [Victivallaceae bacterium]|nr:hypothetical protein [Victivallaceae bacterium]
MLQEVVTPDEAGGIAMQNESFPNYAAGTAASALGISLRFLPDRSAPSSTRKMRRAPMLRSAGQSSGPSFTIARAYDLAGRLVSLTDRSGLTTAYQYSTPSGQGETVALTLPGGRTSIRASYRDRRPLSITGSAAPAQYFTYSVEDGKLTSRTDIAAATSPRWNSNTINQLYQLVYEKNSGFNGGVVEKTFTYATNGRLSSTAVTGGPTSTYTYDLLGNLLKTVLSGSGASSRTMLYDVFFEKTGDNWFAVKTEKIQTDASPSSAVTLKTEKQQLTGLGSFASLGEETDRHGNTIRTEVTVNPAASEVLTEVVYPHTTNRAKQLTVGGYLCEDLSPSQVGTYIYYNSMSQPEYVFEGNDSKTMTYYDSGSGRIGKVSSVSDTFGNETTYDYDPATGELIYIVYPEAPEDPEDPEARIARIARMSYNSFGQKSRIWGNSVYPSEMTYNEYGLLTGLKTYRVNGAWAGDWNSAAWPAPPASIAENTTWEYDAASGLLTAKTDAAGNTTAYTYTVNGNPATRTWVRKINNRSLTTTYQYNIFNELTSVRYPSGTGIPATANIALSYSRTGQPLTVTDAAGKHTFTYNSTLDVTREAVTGSLYTPVLNYTQTTAGFKGLPLNLKLGTDDIYTYTYADRTNGVTLPVAAGGTTTSVNVPYSWTDERCPAGLKRF